MKRILLSVLFVGVILSSGCAVPPGEALFDAGGTSRLRLRQIQTRYFDTSDKQKAMEAVIATLQDLGFVIDKASLELGSVTGTKLRGYTVRMTVNVLPRGKAQMTVRASAQYNVTPVEDPVLYQDFFNALSKSLFLQAHLEE
ncbi:hypothetical protein [Mailhella massiliensis]|uniref:DUF4410 domain-containing protein n=1 Tax=Mailhella massiliensis TaxID=1903261 RepID=A0A921AUN0_9BACT|nr:hypothetical protein [Mailhella massiliensis]HJD96028.1 hypothetical protein [Mailhella massiliensis]